MYPATKPDYEQDGDGDIEIEYVEDEDDIVPLDPSECSYMACGHSLPCRITAIVAMGTITS
uniref:Uncharacterized protein n=2 Tax=Oryza TaxID=4527 RepID=A0A0D3H032_9ORYZ